MAGSYNAMLVVLSILVAILASYAALDLAGRVTATQGRARALWLLGGSVAMGIGIWTMHFVAMLAMHLSVPVSYDVGLVVLSVVAAIAASAVALLAVSRDRTSRARLAAASLAMGTAVAGMHYIGMAAMRMAASLHYDLRLVALSVVIAIVASYVALRLAFQLRGDETRIGHWRRAGAAVVMGIAISGMHFTGMAAAHFTAVQSGRLMTPASPGMDPEELAVAILIFTMILLGMTLLATMIDRQMRARIAEADILRQAEQTVRQSERLFRSLIENSSDMIVILDAAGTVKYLSPASHATMGVLPDALVGRRAFEYVHPEDTKQIREAFAAVMRSSGEPLALEFRCQHCDGSWHNLAGIWKNMLADPAIGGIVVNCRDVTEERRLAGQLTHQSLHDTLTGLANRALFIDRVNYALARAAREHDHIAVLQVDLDDFKRINDSLGPGEGDRLLVLTAERLLNATRGCDIVARLGGDEFAVLLRGLREDDEAIVVGERMTAAMRHSVSLNGKEVHMSASIGIAFRRGDDSADDLLRNADLAMYRAKSRGKGCAEVFEHSMHTAVVARLQLETDLRQAIEREELFLQYQPVVDLSTGTVTSVEALVRWKHPKLGIIPPLDFIPLAEQTGQIVPLGRWVLREACRQASDWLRQHVVGPSFAMAVNISSRQLHDATIIADVREALRRSELDARHLVLEITESVIMHNTDTTLAQLTELKALGVRVAIDDFGTGYSSLSYLQRFPVDVLKIDKSFVDALTRGDPALVRGIVSLATTLGLRTVAEGIEDSAQMKALQTLGCQLGQGYYFAKPMPADMCGPVLARPMSQVVQPVAELVV